VVLRMKYRGKLWPGGGLFQFSFCIGPDSFPELAAWTVSPYLAG
jgi:hypothetical protein